MSKAFLTPAVPSFLHTTSHTKPTCRRRYPRITAATPSNSATNLPPKSANPSPTHYPEVVITHYANNTFTLTHASKTVLLDPWLTDDLVFLTPKFFLAKKSPKGASLASALDPNTISAIILTQGLPDHAHQPTLEKLPRTIPVLAPNSALPLLRSLNYQRILPLQPGDGPIPVPNVTGLSVTPAKGSIVGPPWSEPQLALLLEAADANGNVTTVYHEPHGVHDFDFLRNFRGRLDAVMASCVASTLPVFGNYPLANGVKEAVDLCRITLPKSCVVYDNTDEDQTGFLTYFLHKEGDLEQLKHALAKEENLNRLQVLPAHIGEPITIVGGKIGEEAL